MDEDISIINSNTRQEKVRNFFINNKNTNSNWLRFKKYLPGSDKLFVSVAYKLELDDNKLVDMQVIVKFASSEMSGKLSAKYKFDISDNFNYLISKKQYGN